MSWTGVAGIVVLNVILLFGMNLSNDVFIWPSASASACRTASGRR
jgi:hypothetical protein